MRIFLLALLFPLVCSAADPSVEDQLRALRMQVQRMEFERQLDRSIDAIRAREQAERQSQKQFWDNTLLRDQIERQRVPARW